MDAPVLALSVATGANRVKQRGPVRSGFEVTRDQDDSGNRKPHSPVCREVEAGSRRYRV
ncbi:MAG TPA: hypothetical protein VET88_09405 [Gammaproteobacteria bacterium]|nr:hypothetical protein [Gammaproteobacteria bacterium]